MKQLRVTILALLLMLAVMLTACASDRAPSDDGTGGSEAVDTRSDETESETEPSEPQTGDEDKDDENKKDDQPDKDDKDEKDDTPVTVTERYLPTEVFSRLRLLYENNLEAFSTYAGGPAPYVMTDIYTISDCRLLAIHIPVIKTGACDANGDLTFTVSVFENTYEGLRKSPRRTYSIKINAEEYGLSANATDVYRFIRVPVKEYDICLAADESMGFFSATDTLIPAYLNEDKTQTNEAHNLIKREFPQATGFFPKAGTADIAKQYNSLVYDFEWERTYENQAALDATLAEEAAYQSMLSELRQRYEGKYISILGDSISTFEKISNNTKFNSTIGNNAVFYSYLSSAKSTALFDYTQSYWGRLITDLNMRLCVNNSWSGSRVHGTSVTMLDRCTELDHDNGTPADSTDDIAPDVMIVYIGINDLHNSNTVFGNLHTMLKDGGSPDSVIEAWLDGLTATDFCSTYALSMKAMMEKYPDAEVYCMTLTQSHHNSATAAKIEQYNTCITALANYFGATVINQQTTGELVYENCHGYGADLTALHPNAEGHRLMEEMILKTMYRKHGNQ